MTTHLVKVACALVLTHGFRSLGRRLGPRWAGLALGLPCSSAIALVGGGAERGIGDSLAMAGTSLIGLAGAVTIPVAYAAAIGRGWRMPSAISAALGSYLVVVLASGRVVPTDGWAALALATASVLAATFLAARLKHPAPETTARPAAGSTAANLIRSTMPAACVLGSLAAGSASGPGLAGLFATFPGVSVTVLILTHVEAGPGQASRMARALPAGNLAMVAFLAAFRGACPTLGLTWGTATGYLAALATLATVAQFGPRVAATIARRRIPDPIAWPRSPRKFSPIVEAFAA